MLWFCFLVTSIWLLPLCFEVKLRIWSSISLTFVKIVLYIKGCTLVPNPYTFLSFQKGHFSPYLHSVSKGLSHHLINENCQSNKQNSCLFIKLGTEFLNAKSTETIPNSQFKLGRDFFFFFPAIENITTTQRFHFFFPLFYLIISFKSKRVQNEVK